MFGLINVNKPGGMSSRRAVDVVQRLVRPAKAGHAGTLDPLAQGVLVVCVGPATRLIPYVQQLPKRYRGLFWLGQSSPTDDIEGQVTELVDPPRPEPEAVAAAARRLSGTIDQRPPAYSALKVGGKRAYKLARAGQHVELPSRPVTVYRLEVVRYEYPQLELDVECSAGTYIRSLGRDLAQALGTSAVMAALTRTAVGGFHIEQACDVEALTPGNLSDWLLPPQRAVETLPRVTVGAEQIAQLRYGRSIEARCDSQPDAPQLAALDTDGRLLAILKRIRPATYHPAINFTTVL